MISLKEKTPAYLLGRFQLTATVVFTAFFSIVLLLVSVPFSHNVWFELGLGKAFWLTVLFFLIALMVAVVSKRLLYTLRSSGIPFWGYLLWNAAEVIIICALYTLFTVYGDKEGIITLHEMTVPRLFFNSLLYGFFSLAVPYTLSGMYFDIADKENIIRMISFGDVVTDRPVSQRDAEKIALFDNNGRLRLSLSVDSLYYFESDDNYIKVWYSDENEMLKQYMLRCKLRTVEESFSENGLLRCHRKYIVNMKKVRSIVRNADGYTIDLGLENVQNLPVSKTYEEMILSAYNERRFN